MIHLALPSTLFFISPNYLLESRVTLGERRMGLQTGNSCLILHQASHDFTSSSSFFFISKILG